MRQDRFIFVSKRIFNFS